MSEKQDIIMDLLARLRDRGVELPEDLAWEIEQEIRRDYGGQRIQILKQPPDLLYRIRRLLEQGESTTQICQQFGVSPRTLYRAASS